MTAPKFKVGDAVFRRDPPTAGVRPSKGLVIAIRINASARPIEVRWPSGAVGWYASNALRHA